VRRMSLAGIVVLACRVEAPCLFLALERIRFSRGLFLSRTILTEQSPREVPR